MKKKDYRPEIHELFEKVRNKITVKHEFDIRRLEWLDEEETVLLKQNSYKALQDALEHFGLKKKVFILPFSKKKFTIFPSGKIKAESLV